MNLIDLDIKKRYRSNINNIALDFYIPCLTAAISYQRAVGYFTSNGLRYISIGLKEFIRREGVIQLVASPCLSEKDAEAINNGLKNKDQVILEILLRELDALENENLSDEERRDLSFLSSLVASGRLTIKLAISVDENDRITNSIYHEKLGIFTDAKGNKVAFHGSSNETRGGLVDNFESIMVFKSWRDPEDRVTDLQDDFDNLWSNKTERIRIYSFPDAANARLIRYQKYSHGDGDYKDAGVAEPQDEYKASVNKWRHQDEAI